jgi:hypothetical protein
MTMSLRCDVQSNAIHRSTQYKELSWARRSYNTSIGSHEVRALDVHFISSLPVMQRSACKAWADKRHVQIVWAVR